MPKMTAATEDFTTTSRIQIPRPHGPWASFLNTEAVKETDKALLCFIADDMYWIPKGQISEDSEVWSEGQTGKLVITLWIATQKGLASPNPNSMRSEHASPVQSTGLDFSGPYQVFRALARKYHPDLNPADYASEVMKDLNVLWREVLKLKKE
jgi:hypothetical protein